MLSERTSNCYIKEQDFNGRLEEIFKKTVSEDRHKQAASVSVPEGLWIKCPKCGEMVYREDVISNAYVCPKCGGYFRISAKRRIKMIADKGSFKEWFTGIDNSNPLDYPDYPQKIEDLREKHTLMRQFSSEKPPSEESVQ